MIKKLFISTMIACLPGLIEAQTPNWLWAEAETAGSCYMQGTGIWAGPSDSVYIDGRFGGTMTLGGVSATASGTEVFSGKMGPDGGFKWISPHPYSGGNDYCYGFGADQSENNYAIGLTQGSNGLYIDKYNKFGSKIWSWTLPSNISGYGNVGIDNTGNVYITGGFSGSQNFTVNTLVSSGTNDMFLTKYNSGGTPQWALHAGASGKDIGGRGVAVDPSGNVYVCGCYSGAMAFYDPSNTLVKTLPNTTTPDFFIAKYDPLGNLIWVTTATNAGYAPPPPSYWSFDAITVDSCSNVYVTGHYTSTATFGSLAPITSAGSADIFVAKCLASGKWEWVKTAGGSSDDEGEGIALDKHSDVYVTGYFEGTAKFDNVTVSTTAGSAVFAAKFANSTGDVQWVQAPTGNASSGGNGITVDKNGFVYITGSVASTGVATFGSSNVTGVTWCGQNVLIAKLDTVPMRTITPFPDSAYCAGETITLPYTVTGTFNAGNVFTAQLSDSTGSFSNATNIGNITSTTSGSITITIPANTTPGSTYLIRIVSSNPATSSWASGCGAYFVNNVYVTDFYITINPLPTVTLSAPPTICQGDSATLTASGGVAYTWDNGATSSAITVKPGTNTTFSVSVSNGTCSKDTSILVTVNPLPAVTFTGNNNICIGDSTTITASGGVSYAWSNGATSSAITVKPVTNTTYSVSVNNGSCTKDTTFSVTVSNPPSITLSGNTSICPGDSTTISATGGGTYSWSNGSTNDSSSFKPVTTTTYTLTVDNGCAKDTVITITVLPTPVPSVSPTQYICPGASASLSASGGSSYSWNTGATSDSISVAPASTTTYTVSVSNGACSAIDSSTVVVYPAPLVTVVGTNTITQGDQTPLLATPGFSYTWYPSSSLSCDTCNNPLATPTVTTWYYVTVTDSNGCSIVDSVLITVKEKCGDIYVPTAFSPNGDGWNDVLFVMGNCIQSMTFDIYDRWGNKVFESNDPKIGWDGTFKGQPMNAGTYVFILTATDFSNNTSTKKGNITLVR